MGDKSLVVCACLILSGCSISSWYPAIGAVAGGATGSIAGGPVGGGVGAGVGYAGGKTAQLLDENKDLVEKVEALSTGDIQKLIELEMGDHATGFQEFTGTIKKILTIAGACLLAYLCIPIFLARKTAQTCAKAEAEKHMTRAPFPIKPNEKL
jgi:hypothetical protein